MDYYLKIEHPDEFAPQYAFKCNAYLKPLDGFGLPFEWDYDLHGRSDAQWMQSLLFSAEEVDEALRLLRESLGGWEGSRDAYTARPVRWLGGPLEGQGDALVRLLPLYNPPMCFDEPKKTVVFGWLSRRPEMVILGPGEIFARVMPGEGPELYRVDFWSALWGWDRIEFDVVRWPENEIKYLLDFPWFEPAYPDSLPELHVSALTLLTRLEVAGFVKSAGKRPMVRDVRVMRKLPSEAIGRYPFATFCTHDWREGCIVPPESWRNEAGFHFELGYQLDTSRKNIQE